MWYSQAFDGLVPRRKWQAKHRNMLVGDVCLLKFAKKLIAPQFRLCVVREVEMDANGLVCTCLGAFRPRDARDASLPYTSKMLLEMRVPVQRLVVICPADQVSETQEFNAIDIFHSNVSDNAASD